MVHELALMKLVGTRKKIETFEAEVAVVAQRILLELEPNRIVARAMEEKLVSSHMRAVYSVPEHREYMRTGSPSEPVLVDAAAACMHSGNVKPLRVLSTLFSRGLTTKGERGELVGRLLDILALDDANIKSPKRDNIFPRSTPVTVTAYVTHLIAATHLEEVLNSKPVNPRDINPDLANIPFKEMFSDCWIHTTHYAKAEDSKVLHAKFVWAYWIRGCALQLKAGQELSDRMIPIHWASFPKALDAARNAWLNGLLARKTNPAEKNPSVEQDFSEG